MERNGGRIPQPVRDAVDHLEAVCAKQRIRWRAVVEAHEGVHESIVAAAESERIAEAYARLSGELRLFVIALRPLWSPETMAAHHRDLLDALEREGPPALRQHLADGEASVRRALGETPEAQRS